jgi:hypothetical protein
MQHECMMRDWALAAQLHTLLRADMFAVTRRCIAPLVFLALASLSAPGHAAGLEGDYTGVGNSFFEKISFRSGGKARITAMGMTKVGTYEIDGKEVLITIGTETNVFEIDAQGCVVGGDLLGKYCKGGGTPDTAKASEATPSARSAALSGKYKAGDEKVNLVLDFKTGNKVRILVGGSRSPSDARNATYRVVGDKVTVSDPDGGPPLVLTRKGNVLEGGPEGEAMQMKFVKQ